MASIVKHLKSYSTRLNLLSCCNSATDGWCTQKLLFLWEEKMGSPRSRCQWWRERNRRSGISSYSYESTDPIVGATSSWPPSIYLPKGLPPNTITLRLSFEQMNLVSEWVSEWVIEAAQLCPTLCDPMDCSPPGSSVHGILQARILEWVTIPFSRGSSWPRYRTWVSYIAGRFFYHLSSQLSPSL